MAGLFVLALAVSLPLAAQDSDGAADEADAQEEAREQERDELEPGVPSAVLAADVERRSSGGQVMDELDLGLSEITGNQELPKVLYIVPWQKSDPGELMGKPVNTLLDEVLAPLDRSEFIRQIDYYDDLHGTDNHGTIDD
ncbi:MAG: hypothetical protein WD001_01325 [Woeseia sp.]